MAAVSTIEMTMVFIGLRPMPIDMAPINGMFHRPCRSGTISMIRSRRRRTLANARYSENLA